MFACTFLILKKICKDEILPCPSTSVVRFVLNKYFDTQYDNPTSFSELIIELVKCQERNQVQ